MSKENAKNDKKTKQVKPKRNNPFNHTVNQLKKKLTELEKEFNQSPLRFIEVRIDREPVTVDLSGVWNVVERQLKKAKIESESILEEYQKRNAQFNGLFFEISRIKKNIEKETTGHVKRKQPVIQEKGEWILRQCGEFRSIKEIHNDLTMKQGYTININTLRSFVNESKGKIDKYKEDFRTELLNSSISVDTGRMRFWQEAYNYYYEKWTRDHKMVDFNACAKIITEVKAEIKGDIVVRIDGKIDFSHSIEVNKKLTQRFGELNINLLTIALAANKSNINPLILMTQLINSYYKRWNGIAGKHLELEDKDQLIPVSGYNKNMDWDLVADKNRTPFDFGKVQDIDVVPDNDKESVEDKKQKLLAALKTVQSTKGNGVTR